MKSPKKTFTKDELLRSRPEGLPAAPSFLPPGSPASSKKKKLTKVAQTPSLASPACLPRTHR